MTRRTLAASTIARIEDETRARLDDARRGGFSLRDLQALPKAARSARWLELDWSGRVAITIELLDNAGSAYERIDVEQLLASLDATAARKVREAQARRIADKLAEKRAAHIAAQEAPQAPRPIEALAQPPAGSADHNDPETRSEPPTETLTLDPSLIVALRLVLETQHPSPQFYRALNGDGKRPGALQRLLGGAPFRFNGRLLALQSASKPGRWHTTDGATCSCEGAAHPWCWHRCAWHLVVLALALTDPHGLLCPSVVESAEAQEVL